MFKPGQHLLVAERTKAKSGAARLEGRDDVGQVVADQTEPHVVRELLNHYEEKVSNGGCIHSRAISNPHDNTPLLRAFWASRVIASASSKMTNLKPERKMVLVLAKLSMGPLTTPIPLSSDALS